MLIWKARLNDYHPCKGTLSPEGSQLTGEEEVIRIAVNPSDGSRCSRRVHGCRETIKIRSGYYDGSWRPKRNYDPIVAKEEKPKQSVLSDETGCSQSRQRSVEIELEDLCFSYRVEITSKLIEANASI